MRARFTVSTTRRQWLHAAAAVAGGLLALPALAQGEAAWPTRPVRVIVPFPASGATDLVARVIAQRVSQELGQAASPWARAGKASKPPATAAAA